ncbi:MAG: hypothetical protein ACHREM_25760, partial [Polyangiales bacterium]
MNASRARSWVVLGAVVSLSATSACSNGSGGGNLGPTGPDGSVGDGSTVVNDGSIQFEVGDPGEAGLGTLDVTPATPQTLTVTIGSAVPTLQYQATYGSTLVAATWTVDRGEIGGVSGSGLFTPTGTVAGTATVTAAYGGQSVKRTVLVKLSATQSGPTSSAAQQAVVVSDPAKLLVGGGVGGVGGEGLGTTPSGPDGAALAGTPVDDGSALHLKFLYPYDATVWPRGLRAPLIQWSWDTADADAIDLRLTSTSGAFAWEGSFAKPAVLGTQPFQRMPIPQDLWDIATNSAGVVNPDGSRERLTLELRVLKAGALHGPIKETWSVAPARLAGTVYYNSYGTNLVTNSLETSVAGPYFGAAILAIKVGSTDPYVVAGKNDAPGTHGVGCRVCHTVATSGNTMLVVDGNYDDVWQYDLKGSGPPATELPSVMLSPTNTFGWAGITPDGLAAFLNGAQLGTAHPNAAMNHLDGAAPSALATTGIDPSVLAGTPVFSSDGKHLAFDLISGSVNVIDSAGAPTTVSTGDSNLVTFDFDTKSGAFSNGHLLVPYDGKTRSGFPSFLPNADGVVYHHQLNTAEHRYNTWHSTRAQVWWVDSKTATAKVLGTLNGLDSSGISYLPTGPNNHADDTTLNYEPTVLPVAGGGYAWVIFTSRRMYGSVATTDPWQSDPRDYDASRYENVTTKKLWVAAIDLSAPAGSDPSHPAFYLPAQELAAGNARGFWVLDPCKTDGSTCAEGDECCGGYCQPGDAGAPVCSGVIVGGSCSALGDKCLSDADCCHTGLT